MAVYLVTGVIFFLFFPNLFDVFIYFDKKSGRLNIGVYFYGIIKVFGGFIEKDRKDYVFHYSNKRAKLFKQNDMGKLKLKPKDLKVFEVFTSRLCFSFPFEVKYVNLASIVTCSSNFICPFIKTEKDFIDLKSTVIMGRDDSTKVYYRLKFAINVFLLILLFIKVLVRNEK